MRVENVIATETRAHVIRILLFQPASPSHPGRPSRATQYMKPLMKCHEHPILLPFVE